MGEGCLNLNPLSQNEKPNPIGLGLHLSKGRYRFHKLICNTLSEFKLQSDTPEFIGCNSRLVLGQEVGEDPNAVDET